MVMVKNISLDLLMVNCECNLKVSNSSSSMVGRPTMLKAKDYYSANAESSRNVKSWIPPPCVASSKIQKPSQVNYF